MNEINMNKFGMPQSGMDVVREQMFGGMSLENGPELPELEMPEFGNVAEEPVLMGGVQRMVDKAKGLVGGKEAEAKWRINGLRSLVLMDRDGYFKANVAKHPELNYLTPDRVRADKKGFNMLLGGELSRVIGDGDTYGVLNAAIESMPEEERLGAKARLQQCDTEYKAHELLGELWSGLMQRDFDESKAKHEAEAEKNKERASAALAAVNAELSETWVKKVMSGIGYSPVSGLRSAEALASGAMTQQQLDELEKTSLRAARAFDELMKTMHNDRSYVGHRLDVSKAAEARQKEIDGSSEFLGDGQPPTYEEIWQQTAHDMSSSYKLDRAKIASLVELMKREDGSIDSTAFALFAAACHEAAYGEQAILSSDFWGNFTSALGDWGSETLDFADRVATSAAAETGLMPSGGLLPVPMPTGLHEAAKERQAILFTPDVEKVKGLLARVEDVRRSPAEGMSWVQATWTKLGETAGDSAPFLVGSTINPMLGYAAFFPARTNEAIADNYYEGVTNPVVMAYIEGAWDTLAEGLFAKAVGKLPGVSKGLDWVGLKTVSVPAIGKTLGRIQGNAALRVSTNIALESVGELVVENVVAETGTYFTVRGLRALGVNFDEPEWKPFESSWQQMQNSSQTGATVAYCASLGLLGVPANRRAARDFAKSRKFLLEVGLTEGGVAEVQAAHAEYQKSASAELVRKKYHLEKIRTEAGDKAVEEAENKAGRPLEGKAAEEIRTRAGEKAVAEEVEKILAEQQGALDKTMRQVYDRDVLHEDPMALKKRMEKRGKKFLEDVEVKLYAESGVRDAVLAEEGITVGEKGEKGKRKVQFKGEKEGEVKEVEWTDEQLNAYVAMQRESGVIKRMRQFQTRVAGTALAEAEVTDASVKHELVNMRALPARALARMQRNGGKVDYAVMQDLAEDAAEKISGFVAGGMSGAEARAQMSELPGVTLGTLVQSANAFVQRVEELAGTAEGRALGINKPEDAVTNVFRMSRANAPGQSVLLYNKGLASEREVVEDLLESDVVAAVEGEHASTSWEALEGMLRRVEGELMKYGGGRLFSSKEKASKMAIIEAFSKLGQSYFLLNHGKYQMSAEAHGTIEYVQKKMADAQHLVAMSHAWEAFAKSKDGKAFLKKEGASFEKLLSDAGASVAGHYAAAKFDADAFAAVREAYEGSIVPSLEAAKPVLEQYEAEQKALDRPAAEAVEVVVPPDESVMGEELKLEPEAVVDDSTGDFVPPPGAEVLVDKDEGGPASSEVVTPSGYAEARASEAPALGRGLANGAYVLMEDGSVYGVALVEDVQLSEDVPQFKKKDTAVGRVEADADGTTHELAGGWNANSAPIHVWRRVDGRLEVISGRHRLAHAKKNGVKHIAVRVYDEAAGYDAKWAKLHDVEQNILDNTCNAIDVAYYFRHNPMPLGEAEARGLMPKTKQGEQTAASRMGLHVAAHASDDTFAMLVNGGCTVEDAYMACLVAASAEGQQLALEARAGKKGKKNSWEYVTALVRGAEQLAPADGGGMLDLFGNDESFRESSEKMARYVAAVRAGLKARLNVLQSAGRLNKKESVSKELGVKVKAPKDALRLIERIAMLDAAYERLDYELGIPAKVDAWDGKSAVPTKLDELEAKGDSSAFYTKQDAALERCEVEALSEQEDGGTFSLAAPESERAQRIAKAFHDVESMSSVTVSAPDVYVADTAKATSAIKHAYDELRNTPVIMQDGSEVRFTGIGLREIKNHSADRRVLAAVVKMRELSAVAKYIDNAPNTQKHIPSKRNIERFHYYLSKGNFPEYKQWEVSRGRSAGDSGDAYVLIVVAEDNNGNKFYDLDATDVEEVEANKGVSEHLEATRVPNAGRQDSSTPKGRIHRIKEYVNHIDAVNAEIAENNEPQETPVTFSLRTKEEPIKKGIGYKVFYRKDGKLYPPMVANPGGEDTPVGVWLDADEGVRAGESKTGRPQVKAGGKGTQGGSGTLAYRPGWHLGKIPYALQFNRKNPVTGERDLFPKDFVWAEVEYAADVDYQDEAMSYGVNKNGKFQHSLAGLPRIPEDGYYEYRTNPNPATDPWIITGAMKVKRVLTRAEVDELVRAAGRDPQKVEDSKVSFSVIGQKAKTWDKYTSKAFKGRDDGLMRAEIDASKAKIKWEDLQGKNVAAYRKLVAGWENLPEEERKLVEGYAEQAYDYLEESQKLNNVAEDKVPEQYNKIVKLREELKPKREEVRSLLNKLMVEHGGSAGAVLNMENSELDELAMSLWGPYVESKVVKVLDTRPLWNGSMRLADVLDYAELYEAYPELADVEVRYAAMENANGYAMYGYGEREIWINRNLEGEWEKVHSILLHEVQHHIQDIEGFAKGGNPKSVYKQMKETLGYNEWEMKMLARELRWFSALDYAKDYLRSVRRLLRYPNAWKYNGLRYQYWKASLDGADMTRLLVDDIAGRYEEMRKVDELETKRRGHVIKEAEYLLPKVDFSDLAGVERGLEALDALKPRRSAFRGVAPKKDKKYVELMKYNAAAKRILNEYELEPYELYARLAGEIEARNVQTRRDWTAEQRAAKPFNETLEYPGEALVSFSVIGQKAKTWDKYEDRAFKGRDDGMLRAEIDASQAKLRCRLKPEAQGQAELIAGYRRLKPEVLYSGAEYERMSRAQRLWQVMQAMLGKDEKLVENEHFERLDGYLRRGMSQEEYLRDLGLGEDAGKQEIKAALEAARDAHKEAMWEQVAKERMSREVFEEALAMRMGTAEERERLVLSEDDWVGLGETLGDILDYPELYRAYPALKDVEMVYRQASGSFVRFKKSGELKGAKILLSVSRTEEMMRGSLLHEVQHLIQVYEDFGFGGTARNVGYIFARLGRAEELSGDSEKDYKRLAGEVEARAVNDRKDMTAAARLATPFNESLEYPGEALAYRISEYEAAMDAGRSLVTFSMASVTAEWEDTLDGYLQNPAKPGTPEHTRDMVVCPTPAVMQMVGAKGWDMVVTPGVLDKVMRGKHAVSSVALKQLPGALSAPVCIAASDTPGCLEVVTELKENGHNVLVAVQLDSRSSEKKEVKVNRIASMYGKERIGALLNHPMLYWDKAKARVWMQAYRLQLPAQVLPKRASGRRIQTPADLVKYKMQTGLSFSLSGRGMIDAAPLGKMAGEDKMQRLLNYARKEAGRWTRTFGKDTPNARAAEAMGTVSSILASIHKELPPRFRPRVEGHMRYVEVYARLLESGKVRSYGRLSKEQRAAVEAELLDALREAKAKAEEEYERAKQEALDAAELTGEMAALEAAEQMDVDDEVKRAAYLDRLAKRTADATRKRLMADAEAKKKQLEADIDALTRDFAAEKLAQIASRMLNDAADSVESYLIDEELGAVDVLMERLAPRKLPNGKYDKGKMSADAYRKFVGYVQLMNMSKAEVAEKMEQLGREIAAEEAKSDKEGNADTLEALQAELAEWSTFGNLRWKKLESVRAGVQALTEFAVYEKNAWQGMLQMKRKRIKRQALNAAEALGRANEFRVKEVVEAETGTIRKGMNLVRDMQSISQMFYAMGGVPELRALADESLDALSAGHVALASREKRAFEQLAEYMKKEMGLDTENKRNDFMASLKKLHNTGIIQEGELVRHRLKLTLAEAAEWLELSKAERDAKRAELDAAADKQRVLAENVPYEEDIPLIREELRRIQEEESTAKYVRTVREFRKEALKEPMKLSKDEALNILLLCEQADYIEAAHDNGYTDEVLAKLTEFVGSDVLGFGYAMREVLENNGLAEVYEAREGVPFPKVANYWPGNFDQSARANEQANALDPTSGNGTRYGMLITRVKHNLKFNILGATNVFMAALAQQNNYIVIGELTSKWRQLLSHSDFAMALKAHMGDHSFKKLKELINLLDGAGVQESVTQQSLSGLTAIFQNAHAMAVLAGSPVTLIKQVSAMLNAGAWHGISMLRVAARLILDRAGKGAIKYSEMLKKDYFQARYKDNRYFTEMLQLGRDANWSRLSKWARMAMGGIEKMDVLTNCASMTALYNITYYDLQKRNKDAVDPLTEEELHAECDRVVRNTLELGAQPLRRTQKSAFGALSRNALVKTLCYMSSEAINKIGMAQAVRKREGRGWKGYLKAWKYVAGLSFAQQLVVMAIDMARGADPIDDDEWAEWALLNLVTGASGLGILQTVPLLGEALQWGSRGYVKTGSMGEMVYDFGGMAREVEKAYEFVAFNSEDSVEIKKSRKSPYWQVTYKKQDGSRVTTSTNVPVDGGEFEGVELSKEEAEAKALEVGKKIAEEDAPGWADWGMMGANLLRYATAFTGAWKGINSTSKTMSELSGMLQSMNAVVNTVRPVMQAKRNEEKREKEFKKKLEKGFAKARKATREREKQERKAEEAEKKAEREKREKAKRREERLKRM